MSWKKKRKIHGKNQYYSLSKKLRKESKSNDKFETMLNNLSLEEVIALKLELAAKSAGGYLYGMPIWRSLKYVVENSVLIFALSSTRTKNEAARFLGLKKREYNNINKIYNVESYFEERDS